MGRCTLLPVVPLLAGCSGQNWAAVFPAPCDEIVVSDGIPLDEPSSVGLVPSEVVAGMNAMSEVVVETDHDLPGPVETTAIVDLVLLEAAELVVEQDPESPETCEPDELGERLVLLFQGTYELVGWGSAAGTKALKLDAAAEPQGAHGLFVGGLDADVNEALAGDLDLGCDPRAMGYTSSITPQGIGFSYAAACEVARTGGSALFAAPAE